MLMITSLYFCFLAPSCHLTFETMVSYSTGSNVYVESISVADFNGDHRLDLVTFDNNIGVLLGNGDGTYQAPIMFSTGRSTYPFSIVADDFNSDGHVDLAFSIYDDFDVGVVFGNGDGTFGPLMTYSTGASDVSNLFVAADLNNDNYLDLLVHSNAVLANIIVLLGSSDGAFTVQTRFNRSACNTPSSFAVGDFDIDGQLDLVVTDSHHSYLCVLLGNGNGYFDQPIVFSTGSLSYPESVAVGDFNNDSRLDVAIANSGKNNVGVWLGNGNGSFGVQTTYFTGGYSFPGSVVTGDFNNDNYLDIAVANKFACNVGVFLGTGNGSFLAQTTFPIETHNILDEIAIGDFNSDGKLDLTILDKGHINVIFLLNTCDCCVP